MNGAVLQARYGINAQINANPMSVRLYRPLLVDGGYEALIADPTRPPVPIGNARCRIIHGMSTVPDAQATPSGFMEQGERYMLADWRTEIKRGDRFNAIGGGWEVSAVDPLTAFGAVIGYQARLKEAEAVAQ